MGLLLTLAWTSSIQSQTTVLFEDWNDNTINPAIWDAFASSPNVAELELIDNGDYAFYTLNPELETSHNAWLYSDDSFTRGDNLRCTFLAWGDPSKNGWQGGFPNVASINGPWRQSNTGIAPGNQEACISLWRNAPLLFSQNEWNAGHALSSAYNSAWLAATSKDNAILHRVTLGDTLGAAFDWSIDGGQTWHLERDTRETSGGNQSEVYLGFATSGAAVFVDDILVETGPGGLDPPVPTPTPFPDPGPLFYEDWVSGEMNPHFWLVNVQTHDGQGTAELEEVSPGDWAFYTLGPAAGTTIAGADHTTRIYSEWGFDRGDDLRVTFKAWGDPSKESWGGFFPHNSALLGPWHSDNSSLTYSNPEAMVRYWGGQEEFAQPGDPWTMSPKMSSGWNSVFYTATSKSLAMIFRVWLGDVHGAKIEWSLDGETWIEEYDTRGTPSIGESHATAYLGWGTLASAVFIDDIVVENNHRYLTEPTPTPTGPLVEEDWNSGEIDESQWIVSVQTEDGQGTAELEEISQGDWAFYTLGPAAGTTIAGADHTTRIYSVSPFPRGNNLRVTFKTWGDPTKESWGGTFPSNSSLLGPWHSDNRTPTYSNPEAMVRYWGGQEEFAQPGDLWTESPKMSQEWTNAFYAATSKEDAMKIRVLLGDDEGAMIEWTVNSIEWTTEYNTRGTPPPDGSHTLAFLGWGTYASAVYIDDIVVENNLRRQPQRNATDHWTFY